MSRHAATPWFVFDRAVAGARAREAMLLVVFAALIPAFVHAIPAPVSLGAHLLPMFWAPFLAAFLLRLPWAWLLALAAPTLNGVLSGQPAGPLWPVLTLELAAFAPLASLAVRRWPRLWVAAPLAYLGAKVASVSLIALGVRLVETESALGFAWSSVTTGLPGLVALAALNAWASARQARAGREDAAE